MLAARVAFVILRVVTCRIRRRLVTRCGNFLPHLFTVIRYAGSKAGSIRKHRECDQQNYQAFGKRNHDSTTSRDQTPSLALLMLAPGLGSQTSRSKDEHTIAIRKESIALTNGVAIRFEDQILTSEGGHQHEQA
jgi:hypothetical protein